MDTANRLKWTLLATLGWSAAACGGVSQAEVAGVGGSGGDTTSGGSGGDSSSGGMATQGGSGGERDRGSGGSTTGGAPGGGGALTTGGESSNAGSGGEEATGGTSSTVDCTNPTRLMLDEEETGFILCEEGYRHRAKVVLCENNVDPAWGPEGEPSDLDECETNADCGTELDHCVYGSDVGNAMPTKTCKKGCVEDADCGDGFVCECGRPVGHCIPSNCTTDGDCAHGLCATDDNPSCGAIVRMGCTTDEDECLAQSDCDAGGGCELVGESRQCSPLAVCGRPFLVRGKNRVAELCPGKAFSSRKVGVEIGSLRPTLREVVAEHFTRAGQMEHASIAAFARFSLQLLSLGAPAALVSEATRAQLDEARHAELCFALVEEYTGVPLGPGKLPLHGALEESSFEEVVRLSVLEGCIGEATAALEAAVAAEAAHDPRLIEMLSAIAQDELRHAALAFRFVAWAVEQRPEIRGMVKDWFEEGLAQRSAPHEFAFGDDAETLRAHGVLSPEDRKRVATDARRQIIEPCLRSLLSGQAPHDATLSLGNAAPRPVG